jgi:hypothetical protein
MTGKKATETDPRSELVRSIADQLDPRRFREIAQLCEDFKNEFPARIDSSATEHRDRLVDVEKECLRAAKAVALAPQEVDWMPRAETFALDGLIFRGFGPTQLSILLERVSRMAGIAAKKTVVPRHREVPEKDLCAHYAYILVADFSQRSPTATPGGVYLTVAALLYEFLVLSIDVNLHPHLARLKDVGRSSDANLESSCRKLLKKNRLAATG